jgi:hypothetical protein
LRPKKLEASDGTIKIDQKEELIALGATNQREELS